MILQVAIGRSSAYTRILALAILLTAISLAYAAIIDPVLARLSESRDALAVARERVERYERLVRDAGRIETLLKNAKVRRATGLFIETGTETAASAFLQEHLKLIAAEAGAVATSFFALPVERRNDHRMVPLRIVFSADTRSLQRILYAVETDSPALVIDKIYIHARSGRASESRPLDVEMQVVGFLRAF